MASGNYYMATNQIPLAEKHFHDGIVAAETYDPANEALIRLKTNMTIVVGRYMGDTQSAFDMLAEHVAQNPSKLSGEYAASHTYLNAALLTYSGEEAECGYFIRLRLLQVMSTAGWLIVWIWQTLFRACHCFFYLSIIRSVLAVRKPRCEEVVVPKRSLD